MTRKLKLASTTAVACTAYLCALTPAGQAATVCNEAENSPQGGYVVTGGIVDPVPPAFLRRVARVRRMIENGTIVVPRPRS
jgi:hypothetical protein